MIRILRSNKKKVKIEVFVQILSKYLEKEKLASILEELDLLNPEVCELLERVHNGENPAHRYGPSSIIGVFENYERRLKALERAVNEILDMLNTLEKAFLKEPKNRL